jgi:hypothetical protein
MRHWRFGRVLPVVMVALGTAWPTVAGAQQVFESVGERALGMGGAFVAVADDATAVHWNPAGLASGTPAGMTIGWYRFQSGNQQQPPDAGPLRRSSTFTSLGTWPVGVSYGRFESSSLNRDASGALGVDVLRTKQFGVTILQTVVPGLVVGSTLKYVRGSAFRTTAEGDTTETVLEQAAAADASTKNELDLDVSALADLHRLRVGWITKNLRSPSFADQASPATRLQRQSRLGLAFLPSSGLTLALDVDLNTVDLQGDLRRMLAVGGEGHLSRRLAVRSGIRWNLEGTRRPIAAAGMSLALRSGLWLDGHYAAGRDDESREFGVALRAGL